MIYLSDVKRLDKQFIANTYRRAQVDIVSGKGAIVTDGEGREYVDFTSGLGVNLLGYSHTGWNAAVERQLQETAHVSNLFFSRPQVQLAKTLCERTNLSKAIFTASGGEAVEVALFAARKYSVEKYSPHRTEVLVLSGGYHGATMLTRVASGQDYPGFSKETLQIKHIAPNDTQMLKENISENTCAIVIECIQAKSVLPLQKEYTDTLAKLCQNKDILLLVDETQTGLGRTGRFLCSSFYELEPDGIIFAKGLGGGLPIAATLLGEKMEDTLTEGDYRSTFGGNTLAAAGARAVLASINGKLLDDVAGKGRHLANSILEFPGVTAVTGKGLLLGVKLEQDYPVEDIKALCLAEGLLLVSGEDTLCLLPPLTITYPEMNRGLAVLEQVLKDYPKVVAERQRQQRILEERQ